MTFGARLLIVAILLSVACTPAPRPAPRGGPASERPATSQTPKIINVAINEDPPSFWEVAVGGGGNGGGRALLPAVNQFLAVVGADGTPHPRLLAELPSLERGTWRVAPDGSMETVWRIRSDARWHDGTPFTTDDLIFSVELNRDPEIPNSNRAAVTPIVRMEATSPTDVLVSWSQVYPFADRLADRELMPVPKHLLESTYRESKDALINRSYWNVDYVGLGPYRVNRWERGAFLELAAFDGYFLGRPKIDTIRVQFIVDENTLVANLLSHAVHAALPPGGGNFEPLDMVRREWEATGYGTALSNSEFWTFVETQKIRNPSPPDINDPRVRRAMLHGLDRAQIVQVLYGDRGIVGDSWLHPDTPRYRRLSPAITRYAYDPRRASELLAEAGWRPAPDGILEKDGQRFNLKVRVTSDERIGLIFIDNWRAIGIAGEVDELSLQAQRDRMLRATFTGVDGTSNPMTLLAVQRRFSTASIPTPENAWTGVNRGGYSNPEWDALADATLVALEESRQLELEERLLRIMTTDLPALPLTYNLQLTPVGGGLTGIEPIRGVPHTGTILYAWNIHEWDLRTR
jgi:peptide/nickel transport system substrate-binding protein